MTADELCKLIELKKEAADPALAFAEIFDFSVVDPYLSSFRDYEKMEKAEAALEAALGEDKDHSRILACHLKGAADAYEFYRDKGIGDEIYIATMKCFSRFCGENFVMTGKYNFDREFWTPRQIGFHLFRLTSLEYELVPGEEGHINIHIPSDADFSPISCSRSLEESRAFIRKYFPAFSGCPYLCDSWLLSPDLEPFLPKHSNIRSFRERFSLLGAEESNDVLEWLFYCPAGRFQAVPAISKLQALPEKSSLQRAVKEHLLKGGRIRNGFGRLL